MRRGLQAVSQETKKSEGAAIQFRVWTLKAWVYHNEVNDVIMCIRFAMTLFGGPLGKKLIGLARKAKGFSSGGL